MSTTTQIRTRSAVSAPKSVSPHFTDEVDRVPTSVPPFGVGDIRRAIPAHCFQRSLITSYSYVLWDVALIGLFVYGASHISSLVSDERFGSVGGPLLRACSWILYWIATGCVSTGLWVIGHECGHGGFANSAVGNDFPGFLIHSLLLVPYFSWKISHRRHHSNTGNLDADEVFVPTVDKSGKVAKESLSYNDPEESVLSDLSFTYTLEAVSRFLAIFRMVTVGWPAYLISNVTAHQNYSHDKWNNHFNPYSEIFIPSERFSIMLSDAGLLGVLGLLAFACQQFGAINVLFYYFVPYLIVNFWLVLITFLQHTDLALPHYAGFEWDWLRGALATVDRDYGILNHVFHRITDTHVVHHLFSNMPHYHAEEATEAVKPLLKSYYRFDSTPIFTATWKIFGRCHAVKPQKDKNGIFWF